MSLDPVVSSQGNLDEQIAQLMQCKPLSEQEVNFHFFCCFLFCGFCISCCILEDFFDLGLIIPVCFLDSFHDMVSWSENLCCLFPFFWILGFCLLCSSAYVGLMFICFFLNQIILFFKIDMSSFQILKSFQFSYFFFVIFISKNELFAVFLA